MDKYADRVARVHAAMDRGIAGVLCGAGGSRDMLENAINPIMEDLKDVLNRYGERCWPCAYIAMAVVAQTVRAQLPQDLAALSDILITQAEVTAVLRPAEKKGGVNDGHAN